MQWLNKRDKEGLKPMDRVLEAGELELSDVIVRTEMHDERNRENGANPLHFAAAKGLTEAIECMLRDGFRPNSRDDLGETALHTAVRHNHLFATKALLKQCRPTLPNNLGMTPLHWAVMVDNMDIVRALIENGADPDAGNIQLNSLTPRKIAELLHRSEVLDILGKCTRTVAA